jgi:hypothetical protein
MKRLIGMRSIPALLLIAALGACSGLTPDDPAATLRAEREGYVREATAIADAALAQRTQVIETAVAAQTAVSAIENRNALLLATLRAAVPPTQQIVDTSGVAIPGQVATPAPLGSGGTPSAAITVGEAAATGGAFVDTTTATTVLSSNGCADQVTTAFPADIGRVYVVTRATTIAAGTVMRVQWTYGGDPAFSESFTVGSSQTDYCLWFYIEPTADVLSPGGWTVQLYADEQPIEPVVSFTVG